MRIRTATTPDRHDTRETPSKLPRNPWAAPLAAAGLVTAAAHLPVTGEHLDEALYIGVLFIALEVVSVVLAAALLVRPTRVVLLTTAVVGALAVLALVLSRTVGLPSIGDDVGDWTEPLAVVSVAAEAIMAVGGAVAASTAVTRPPVRVRLAGVVAGVLLLAAGAVATGLASSVEAAHHDGTTEQMPGMHDMTGMDGHMPGMRMGLSAGGDAPA